MTRRTGSWSRRALVLGAASVGVVLAMSSVAFACTYYKGKFKVTDSSKGANHKTTYGMGRSNFMMYCLTGPSSDPEIPLQSGSSTIRLQVDPYDCNQDGIDEYLNDGQGGPGPTPFVETDGKYDVNYARLVPGTTYWAPEGGNVNDCMTPSPLVANTRVVVAADAMTLTAGSGAANLTLPGAGDYTVCVSARAPDPLKGEPFQYDAIQNSVRVI